MPVLTVFLYRVQAADSAEEDMATANFNAVLRASNDLTNQMDFVTHQMAPCFPKYWALEALWTSVVADVCSQQILGQIGGRDAHRLPDLTVTQLLDLVAWIESFREKIEDAFPDIVVGKVTNGPKPSIESGASLLHGEGKEIDVVRAKESVEWVSGVLWEVHRLAQDEFLVRTRAQAEEWLENVYRYRVSYCLCRSVFFDTGTHCIILSQLLISVRITPRLKMRTGSSPRRCVRTYTLSSVSSSAPFASVSRNDPKSWCSQSV
jgi:hypothetical protein